MASEPGPGTMIQPTKTPQNTGSGEGPCGPCNAGAGSSSGRDAAREQQPTSNRIGQTVAIVAPSGEAINQSTVGLTGLANAMVSGACIAMLRGAAIRKPLANQKRIARSSHAPPAPPSACIDDIAERTTAIPAR